MLNLYLDHPNLSADNRAMLLYLQKKYPFLNFKDKNPLEGPRPEPIIEHSYNGRRCDIYYPTLDQIQVGQRIQAYWRGNRGWGQKVEQIDIAAKRILIRNYIGGTMERCEWIPFDRIIQIWTHN